MSTYISRGNRPEFRIDAVEAPGFLKEYLNYLLVVRNLAPRTCNDYYVQLREFLRWTQCRNEPGVTADEFRAVRIDRVPFDAVELTTPEIYEYLSFAASVLDNQNTSRALKLSALKGFYKYYTTESPRLETDPVSPIRSPKKEKRLPKYLTLKESKKLLESVGGEAPERDYCIVTLFLNCGMRLSELVAIDLADVREDTLRLYGKGRKERLVYLNDACKKALADCLAARTTHHRIEDKQALFISKRTGKRLTGRRVEQIVEKTLAKAGLYGRGLSPHKLRHTAATLLYQSGADVMELKELLGHENIATTEIYTHLDRQQMKTVMDRSPLAGVKKEP